MRNSPPHQEKTLMNTCRKPGNTVTIPYYNQCGVTHQLPPALMTTIPGPQALFEREDNWRTAMGAFLPGEGRIVFRGKDLFRDLNNFSWMALLLYGITGRTFSDNQLQLFERSWTLCASYPDPRIWNNRIAALAGTARSTTALALGAANAISEATHYGQRPNIRSIDFFLRTQKRLDDEGICLNDAVALELQKHKRIYGYGRPVVNTDERIGPIMEIAKTLGLADGPYVKLAFAVEQILLQHKSKLHMNIAGLLAALAADQGLSPREYYRFMVLRFSAGMMACYIDAMNQPEGALFPLRCDRLAYSGTQPRRIWQNT